MITSWESWLKILLNLKSWWKMQFSCNSTTPKAQPTSQDPEEDGSFRKKNNNKTKRKQFQLIFIENFPYESHTPIYIVDWDAQDGSDLVGWWDFRIWVRKRKLEFDRTTKRYIFWALHPAESLTHSYKSLAKDFTENQWN